MWLRRSYPGAEPFGADIALDLLDYARDRVDGIHIVQTDGEQLPFLGESFDVVFALQVVEHFHYPQRFLGEARRVLRQGGLLLLSTPNPLGCAARLLGRGWHGFHYQHVSLKAPQEWRGELHLSGFDVLDDGTTLFNGVPIVGRLPIRLPFQVLQALFGYFPWQKGESYMAVASKR